MLYNYSGCSLKIHKAANFVGQFRIFVGVPKYLENFNIRSKRMIRRMGILVSLIIIVFGGVRMKCKLLT